MTTSYQLRKLVVNLSHIPTMTKPAKLTAVALSVFRLNGLLIEWGNTFAAPHGLTSARWQVLGAISMAPEAPNIPQIADAMGISRQAVLKQINVLVEEGLVQPLPNPTHKRSPLYALTPRGTAAYQAVVGQWQQHVRDIAGQFSSADLDAAIRVLSTMSGAHAPNGQA
ncbi:MarR family winged helix-turn-helix transcriptional regulator [Burkholderia sp. AU33545]|nr:MarR family winged helix-turn-helix transcriptional regulator [Burkholderia sp. AU33545]